MDPHGSVIALATKAAQHFLGPRTGAYGSNSVRFHDELHRHLCDRSLYRRYKIRSFVRDLFVPNEKDRAFLDLPERVWFLYHAIRPARLVHDRLLKSRFRARYRREL